MPTWRILKGQRLNGTYGFDVSKPGFDVRYANLVQMAFSSDAEIPRLVKKGMVVSYPTSGAAPYGSGVRGGAVETRTSIYYGRTLSIAPTGIAIATAPSWPLPLYLDTSQATYLNNAWHTEVIEAFRATQGADTLYGYNGLQPVASPNANGHVNLTWRAIAFFYYVFSDRIEFVTNCQNAVTIRYLVLE